MVQYSPVMEDVNEFLGVTDSEFTAPKKSWTISDPLLLNIISFDFKIYTRTDVTVISENMHLQATHEYCVATLYTFLRWHMSK